MAAKDYTALDAEILKRISAFGPVTFHVVLNWPSVAKAAEAIPDKAPAWRVVDRRLQALRKAGKIRYARKPEGWTIVKGA